MIIYIDLLILLNFIYDFLIIKVVSIVLKRNTNETLKYTDDPIVSSDIISSSCGATVDGSLTSVLEVDGKQLIKVVAWYDNEMGYSYQMVRTMKSLFKNM